MALACRLNGGAFVPLATRGVCRRRCASTARISRNVQQTRRHGWGWLRPIPLDAQRPTGPAVASPRSHDIVLDGRGSAQDAGDLLQNRLVTFLQGCLASAYQVNMCSGG